MKNLIAFCVYLVALLTYVVLTKDVRFLVMVVGLFISVASVTFFVLMFHNRGAAPKPRERRLDI